MLLQICLYITNINGAPKFGNLLYDPLTYEAMKHGGLEYNNPPQVQARTQDNEFDGPDDDDYLEHSRAEKETLTVPTPLHVLQNESTIETTNAPISEKASPSTIEPTPTTEATTEQIKQSSLGILILRQIVTESLVKDFTKHFEQTTSIVSGNPKNEKTIAIARSSCISCVGDIQNRQPVALRQGDPGGDSVKKSGYDYDEKVCKTINGRILCGYNKNVGEIQDDKVKLNIDGNCQMRDDRIECGYVPANKPADIARTLPPINDISAETLDPLPENNSTDSSVVLRNGVRDSPESLGYPTNNYFSEPDSNIINMKQTISEVSSQQNVMTLETVAGTITTASTEKSVDIVVRSNTEPVELLNTYLENVNNAIGNFEPTISPQFYDNPDVIDYVTTINESINFVAEAQVQRRVEKDVQLTDTNGPDFDKNIDRNYLQNPNSVKEKNEPHVEITSDISNYKRVTRCVEIGDRIVCYNIQLNDITPHM